MQEGRPKRSRFGKLSVHNDGLSDADPINLVSVNDVVRAGTCESLRYNDSIISMPLDLER
jgi:hypothetical protein